MHPYKLALAASTALMASMSASFATTIAQTVSFSSLTDWGTNPANAAFVPTKTLSFAGFTPSLGTLNSVIVTIYETIHGDVNLSNAGANTTNVSASLLNTLKYFYPTITTKTSLAQSNTYEDSSLAPGATSGKNSVSGGTTLAHTVSTGLSNFDTSWKITLGDLGKVTIGSGNSNGKATYTDTGAVKIVADYSYTAAPPPPPPPPPSPPPPVSTPEPGTLTILGAGLAGLGLLRRRKKST
jgi:hypothetical protein